VALARDPQPEPPAAVGPALTLQPTTDLGVFIAALTISSLIPIALILLFRRLFLGGQGLSGAIKG
jgi:multiple sugar transport system permease protein